VHYRHLIYTKPHFLSFDLSLSISDTVERAQTVDMRIGRCGEYVDLRHRNWKHDGKFCVIIL